MSWTGFVVNGEKMILACVGTARRHQNAISDLTLNQFATAVAVVNRALANEKACFALLDEARQDTLIIEQLLQELLILESMPPCAETEKGLQTLRRDLTVLLALRAIERNRTTLSTNHSPEAQAHGVCD